MLGAIAGDIIGSIYEFECVKTKDFELFPKGCFPTDDSLMTIAVGLTCVSANLDDERDFEKTLCQNMRMIGRLYPGAGYGESFFYWLHDERRGPYGSFGNGSAMRVSPVAYAAKTLEEAEKLAEWSAKVTHNHPEGIKGAKATAAAVFMARLGASKEEIRAYIEEKYYSLDFTVDEIRPFYSYYVTCQGSVPESIECFLEAKDYEDTVRNAVSLGGDGDTMAAIAGAIAEAFFGIPENIAEAALGTMDEAQRKWYDSYAGKLYGQP